MEETLYKDNLDNLTSFLFQVMEKDTDVLIADGEGVVLKVNKNYEKNYQVTEDEVVGKNVQELEDEGVFTPSVTTIVMREKKKVTIMQKNRYGEEVLTTGVPIFDEMGLLKYVVSFPALHIAESADFNQQYRKLSEIISKYTHELEKLNEENTEFQGLTTKNKEMSNIYQLVNKISHTSVNVMIQGETGTGKSMLANLIHNNSPQADGPFIVINCGAIPSNLMESELFGYVKGAFSGASDKGYTGKVQLANGGTLFLDEIGELSLDMQKKLLQLTQEHRIMPVGGTKYKSVDFRLIVATNSNLEEAIKQGLFRQDLYYRLNVVSITLPSLKERKEDILFITLQMLDTFNKKYGKETMISEECLDLILKYTWPGNIRELQNAIERMVVICKRGVIEVENIPEYILEQLHPYKERELTLKARMESLERMIIQESFARNKNTMKMAQELGIAQSSVVRKLQRHIPEYGNK